ncbi:leucine-rich repeats and immunoglobulin-like domains protein 3 [Ylistrum balloti]|uniref:leucine-rich repeats and immunoglobulin-like domains protein 3 n=1 Tax=Ylistrum balloti TaxID=509963 RepID=UPI002905E45B|nr:leucine-rich repeats and immunoglobulin-like domains protein 3 [Ylistrum balloti]
MPPLAMKREESLVQRTRVNYRSPSAGMTRRSRVTCWILLLQCLVELYATSCPEVAHCICTLEEGSENDTMIVSKLDCGSKRLSTIPNLEEFKNAIIRKLILSNNSFQSVNLNKSMFRGLKIEELDLSHNRFGGIRDDVFRPIRSTLRILLMDDINLRFNNINFLKRLMRLDRLSLRHNVQDSAVRLNGGRFPTSHLLQLDLSHNKFTKISDNAFTHLRATLQTLYLENVGLDFNNLNFLTNMTKLQSLYLGSNGKYPLHLDGEPFFGLNLRSLKYLGLNKCEMALAKENIFEGLENLTHLDLSGNMLHVIPSAILKLTSLVSINLSQNIKLDHIQDRAFVMLSNLKEINLRGTDLRIIAAKAFSGLEETLETLLISNARLPGGYFWIMALRPLRTLKILDFSYNKINHISNDTFGSLQSLQELDMSGNPLLEFTDNMFEGIELTLKRLIIRDMRLKRLPTDAIVTLRHLDVLDASDNMFPTLFDNFFSGLRARVLVMKNSHIMSVSPGAFHGLKGPLSIIMDGNNISDLSFLHDLSPYLVSSLSVSDNPLMCDCTVLGIVHFKIAGQVHGTCADEDNQRRNLQHISDDNLFLEKSTGSKQKIVPYKVIFLLFVKCLNINISTYILLRVSCLYKINSISSDLHFSYCIAIRAPMCQT